MGVTIIEAESNTGKETHTGYYGVTKKTLDKTVVIQEYPRPILSEIPCPTVTEGFPDPFSAGSCGRVGTGSLRDVTQGFSLDITQL